MGPWRQPGARAALVSLLALGGGCQEGGGPLPLLDPPDGAVLADEVDGLEIYVDGESDVCLGSVRRAGRHWRALLDVLGEDELEGRLVLFDGTENMPVHEACDGYFAGCATVGGGIAFAKPEALTHELVHVALDRWSQNRSRLVPLLLREGLASYWSGEWISDFRATSAGWSSDSSTLEYLMSAEADRYPSDYKYRAAMHAVAWLDWQQGPESLLEAYRAMTDSADRQEAVEILLETFDYDSLEQMQARYEEEAAYYYPLAMDSAWRPSLSVLEQGVEWARESCPGPAQVGPEVQGYGGANFGGPSQHPRLVLDLEGGVYGAALNVPDAPTSGGWLSPELRGVLEAPVYQKYGGRPDWLVPDCSYDPVYGDIYFDLAPGRYEFVMAPWQDQIELAGGVITGWVWRAGDSCDDPNFRREPPPGLPHPPWLPPPPG